MPNFTISFDLWNTDMTADELIDEISRLYYPTAEDIAITPLVEDE